MPQLLCENLNVGYDGKTVLCNVSFSVNHGDYLCIVGENGSGKTTLMKTVLGLITPLGGKIVSEDGLKRNKIGYLPQQTVVQKDFPATVYEIVISGFCGANGISPFYTKEQKNIALKNMEKMGVLPFKNRCYRELSGGQQQRVLLSRALCATEEMILLDEPVSGLDPKVTAEMYELISKINKDGTTVIMISHDTAAALNFASHILHIGKDVFFGTKEEYLNSRVGSAFLNGGNKSADI